MLSKLRQLNINDLGIELVELVELVESGKDLANGFSQRDSSTLTFAMVGDII